jgi:hypothetical protein
LNSAANPADERVSIGARALTGDDYHGHVFWDTEIYLLLFYILTWPEAARTLLMYRFRTLEGARAKILISGNRETSSRPPAFSLFLPGSCPNTRDRRKQPTTSNGGEASRGELRSIFRQQLVTTPRVERL